MSTWLPREIEAKRGAMQNVLRPIAASSGRPIRYLHAVT